MARKHHYDTDVGRILRESKAMALLAASKAWPHEFPTAIRVHATPRTGQNKLPLALVGQNKLPLNMP